MRFHPRTLAVPAVLASLATAAQARATFVMGGDQTAPSGSYFTEISTSFTVPPAPTAQSSAITNIWPGLEDGQGTVLQPVLSYGTNGNEGWQMQNLVVTSGGNSTCTTAGATRCDSAKAVKAGDNIFAAIAFDQSNPGSGCNASTGANCNYNLFWLDFTSGAIGILSDWTQASPLIYAQGLIFEQTLSIGSGLPTASSCSDYPLGALLVADVALYHKVGSNYFSQIPTNLSVFNPGTPPATYPDGCNGPYLAAANGQSLEMLFF